jgi:hypothetical protein
MFGTTKSRNMNRIDQTTKAASFENLPDSYIAESERGASVPNHSGNYFHHRHNRSGTYDSICNGCFMTVASTSDDTELAPFEGAHVCDPIRAYQVSEFAYRAANTPGLGLETPPLRRP